MIAINEKVYIQIDFNIFIVSVLVQYEKSSIFVHDSVAKYHVEFVNGNIDSVYEFQQKYPQIVQDKYVYIAYLHIYCNHKSYEDLLKSHLKYTPAD